MSQYLLSVHSSTADYEAPIEEREPQYAAVGAFNDEIVAEGVWVFAGGLKPIEATTTVDASGADVVTADGPYLETKEYLGGFWVIEVPDLDAALKIAARASKACGNKVEVRPFEGA